MLTKELMEAPGRRLAEVGREKFPVLQSYLAFMRQSLGPRVDNLDLSKVNGLKVVEGRLIIESIDKSSINKLLQESISTEKEEVVVPPSVVEGLKRFQDRQMTARIEACQAAITQATNNAIQRSGAMMEDFKIVTKNAMEIEQLKNGVVADFGLVGMVKKILEDAFWKNPEFGTVANTVQFTAENVWLNFNDNAAKVNKRINVGNFKLLFTITDRGIGCLVRASGNNITVSGYVHPHVAGETLCLGNASGSWSEASKKLDIARMAHITRLILTQYNPDNPYVGFSHFEAEFNRRQRASVRVQNEQQIRTDYEARVATSNDSESVAWFDDEIPNF